MSAETSKLENQLDGHHKLVDRYKILEKKYYKIIY